MSPVPRERNALRELTEKKWSRIWITISMLGKRNAKSRIEGVYVIE